MKVYHKILYSLPVLILIGYLLGPHAGQIDLATCAPKNVFAQVSETLYGKFFPDYA